MNSKKILLLLVLAVVLLGVAFWSQSTRKAAPPSAVGRRVLSDLDLNAVASVEVAEDGTILRMHRKDDRWVATNAFDYPLDFGKLRERLLTLRNLRIGQVQRGMKLPPEEVTRVSLLDGNGNRLARLLLGAHRSREGGGGAGGFGYTTGRYVALENKDSVYLVKESLSEWNPDVEDWLDTRIFESIASSDIRSIELRNPSGEHLVLSREDGQLSLQGLDEEVESFNTGKSYSLESALSYLRFNNIADPALTREETGIATGHMYRVNLKNGESYIARVGASPPESSDRYATFSVNLAPATTNDAARLEQETRVADWAARVEPWTYLIPSHNADNMILERNDLVTAKSSAPKDRAVETNAGGTDVSADETVADDRTKTEPDVPAPAPDVPTQDNDQAANDAA